MRRRAFLAVFTSILGFVNGCAGEVEDSPEASSEDVGTESLAFTLGVEVTTGDATAIARDGFSANARIQPHGKPTSYWFEYGATTDYGSSTARMPLGPKLAAFYQESWDKALGGWRGGIGGDELVRRKGANGGFVSIGIPSGDDPNHEDGIGFIQLTQYLHNGTYTDETVVSPYMGGGDTDLRDAKIAVDVRGRRFRPNGAELTFWAQTDLDLAAQNDTIWRRANWAFTGFSLNDALLAGGWQHVEYRLDNDTTKWTYAGTSVAQGREGYIYGSIDRVLAHMNCDFMHVLAFIDLSAPPTGRIDYDELTIAYRNHSLVFPSNGGRLVSAPEGSTDAAALTDGYRHGDGKTWQTAPWPVGPQDIEYAFARPVTVRTVQIHQDPDSPSKRFEVYAASDSAAWTRIAEGTLPKTSKNGPNFMQVIVRGLEVPATRLKVRVLSGYQATQWGLGEIEIFGDGAVEQTDDDWYNVNTDIVGISTTAPTHYRIVATDGTTTTYGPDRVYTVPMTFAPVVETGAASRIKRRAVKLEGRMTPMGKATEYWFEFGTTTKYDDLTNPRYGGLEKTPRTVTGSIDYLRPNTTYHYRLVAKNNSGTRYGADRTFTTAP